MVHQTILAAGSMLGLLPKLLGNYFGATPSDHNIVWALRRAEIKIEWPC